MTHQPLEQIRSNAIESYVHWSCGCIWRQSDGAFIKNCKRWDKKLKTHFPEVLRLLSKSLPKKKVNTKMSKTNKPVNSAAAELGRKGGLKGGAARSNKLSKQERSEIASKGGKSKAAKNTKRK